MEPQDVIPLIEGEPFVSVIPVERVLSNIKKQKNGDRIVGFNTEDADNHEGMVKYDIVCYCMLCSDERWINTSYY